MEYAAHHCIVVTARSIEAALAAHRQAAHRFRCAVSPLVESPMSGTFSFFVPPEGAQALPDESDRAGRRRAQYLDWLGHQRYADGGSPYDWVEVRYGDEAHRPSVVVRDSEAGRFRPPPPGDEIPF